MPPGQCWRFLSQVILKWFRLFKLLCDWCNDAKLYTTANYTLFLCPIPQTYTDWFQGDYIKFANIFWQTYKLPNYILPTFILPTLHFTKLFLCKLTIYQTFSSKVTNSQRFSAKLFLSLILQIACTKSLIKMTYNSWG